MKKDKLAREENRFKKRKRRKHKRWCLGEMAPDLHMRKTPFPWARNLERPKTSYTVSQLFLQTVSYRSVFFFFSQKVHG